MIPLFGVWFRRLAYYNIRPEHPQVFLCVIFLVLSLLFLENNGNASIKNFIKIRKMENFEKITKKV